VLKAEMARTLRLRVRYIATSVAALPDVICQAARGPELASRCGCVSGIKLIYCLATRKARWCRTESGTNTVLLQKRSTVENRFWK